MLAHYGLAKRANAHQGWESLIPWRPIAKFIYGANPTQFMTRNHAMWNGIFGGLGGTVIGGIHGAYNAEPGSRLSGAARGAGKGLVAGTALGAGAGAMQGFSADPMTSNRARNAYRDAINAGLSGLHL